MLIGAVALDEPLTWWLAIGAVLVVGGVALTQRGRGRPRRTTGELDGTLAGWPAESSAPSRSGS